MTRVLQQDSTENYIENVVSYYRFLLSNPSVENDMGLREIGRALYDLLIKPVFKTIQDKKNLLIIPDGVLSFIPFETLIDEDGK